jgi:hypothetical protein
MKRTKLRRTKFLYMRSFGRSGETLLMRSLDAHPQIHALVQLLNRRDEKLECYRLFRYIMKTCPASISRSAPLRLAIDPIEKPTLLVKAGCWEPSDESPGFVLIRNPFAVTHSYLRMYRKKHREDPRRPLAKWIQDIDEETADYVNRCDAVTGICVAWNRCYANLSLRNKPVVRYEQFVRNPSLVLKALLQDLSLPWADSVMHSEKKYKPNQIGHGGISLSEPIHDKSLDAWKRLGDKKIAKIRALCYPTMRAFGYDFNHGELTIQGQ